MGDGWWSPKPICLTSDKQVSEKIMCASKEKVLKQA